MRKYYTPLCTLLCFSFASVTFACTSSHVIPQVSVNFYDNPLGVYTIDLGPTLAAIASGQADNQGDVIPYFEKKWTGECPGGLEGGKDSCREYTVYPNDQNFSPAGIMDQIKAVNHGEPNRGEVRILTNASETQYAYTTDHEAEFCGPYNIS